MTRPTDPRDDSVDYLLWMASVPPDHVYARSMLDTLRLIQVEPWQHTYDDLVTRDHEAGIYLPIMKNLRWIQPDRYAPDMSGRQPRWRVSSHMLET